MHGINILLMIIYNTVVIIALIGNFHSSINNPPMCGLSSNGREHYKKQPSFDGDNSLRSEDHETVSRY